MKEILERLIDRFPDFKTAARKAADANTNLGELFREFETVEHRLSKFEDPVHSADHAEHHRLRHRRALLEEELLTMMQHYGRR